MQRAASILSFLLFLAMHAIAQRPAYPQGYFRNPLDIPILLAGNFGECRPGHFHSGLDIKTGGHEHEPVYAAADGYVSRIKMEPGGFGHGLYITHPNGYTTLYAHLNDFVPAIQAYVRKQQYAKESWTVDLSFSPEQFPVKKGQQIAWSGNTGGSTAPHLHFEIRDSKTEHPLNPQLFGFEIKDTKPPVIKALALYQETSLFPPYIIPVKKTGSLYRPKDDTIRINLAGLGIVADDFMEGSDNKLAFYTAEWYEDDSLQGRIRLDDIGYDETLYVDAYADYGVKQRGGPWVQRLFPLKGNRLRRIYESLNVAGGLTDLTDGFYHRIRIELTDAYGNSSRLEFVQTGVPLDVAYGCSAKIFKAGTISKCAQGNISFYLDETALYDDACMEIRTSRDSAALSLRFKIGTPDIPVHHYFDLSLKPDRPIPFAWRSKVAMIYTDGKDESGRAATLAEQGWYKASVRELGEYRLVADTTAPLVKPLASVKGDLSKAKSIAFRATDNFTSVKSFRGELDGAWILFEQHADMWTYVFDEHCPPGAHKLVVKASDENSNEVSASYNFTR